MIVITQFDLPRPKTRLCTQTLRIYLLYGQNYCQLKFYTAVIGYFVLFADVILHLNLTTRPSYMYVTQWPISDEGISTDQKSTFYVEAFKSYRITQAYIYTEHTERCDQKRYHHHIHHRPALSWCFRDYGTRYKTADLLTYLPRHFAGGNKKRWRTDSTCSTTKVSAEQTTK